MVGWLVGWLVVVAAATGNDDDGRRRPSRLSFRRGASRTDLPPFLPAARARAKFRSVKLFPLRCALYRRSATTRSHRLPDYVDDCNDVVYEDDDRRRR